MSLKGISRNPFVKHTSFFFDLLEGFSTGETPRMFFDVLFCVFPLASRPELFVCVRLFVFYSLAYKTCFACVNLSFCCGDSPSEVSKEPLQGIDLRYHERSFRERMFC